MDASARRWLGIFFAGLVGVTVLYLSESVVLVLGGAAAGLVLWVLVRLRMQALVALVALAVLALFFANAGIDWSGVNLNIDLGGQPQFEAIINNL